ncbi:methylthioribulose-1-phosphate dehydratase isoform X2 [Petromyzon marinus]|uniref:methylthioribulose-1-phosphate dehydratase isoform X2 n=1 Tax=Petromyzon marinus TaxID=7757 RepID=UPI003F6E89FB
MSEQQAEKSLARLVKDDDDEVEVVDDEVDDDEPRALIRDLCRLLYHLGWATGTGGGVSIRRGDKIYMAPSGVQKERIKPSDVFELDSAGCVVSAPLAPLTLSQCAPLFMLAYSMRGAGCVIHTHCLPVSPRVSPCLPVSPPVSLCLPVSPRVSPCLPVSPRCWLRDPHPLCLPVSPTVSPCLPVSPRVSPCLPVSPRVSHCLPVSPRVSQVLAA